MNCFKIFPVLWALIFVGYCHGEVPTRGVGDCSSDANVEQQQILTKLLSLGSTLGSLSGTIASLDTRVRNIESVVKKSEAKTAVGMSGLERQLRQLQTKVTQEEVKGRNREQTMTLYLLSLERKANLTSSLVRGLEAPVSEIQVQVGALLEETAKAGQTIRSGIRESSEVGLLPVPTVVDYAEEADLIPLDIVANEIRNTTKCIIHLFYDAECPYAAGFITEKLYPLMQSELGKYAVVDPNPWGTTSIKSDGTYRCRGETECEQEITHACVLNTQNSTTAFKFIKCSMEQGMEGDRDDEFCARELGINYEQLSKCVNGKDGKKYFDAFGEKTKALNPRLHGVPTVCFDNKCGKNGRAKGTAYVKARVCEKAPAAVRRAHCRQ